MVFAPPVVATGAVAGGVDAVSETGTLSELVSVDVVVIDLVSFISVQDVVVS